MGQAEQPERYLTRRELAALMGVSVDAIDRMVTRGSTESRTP